MRPRHLLLDETCFRRSLRRLTLWPLAAMFMLISTLFGLTAYLLDSGLQMDRTNEVLAQLSRVEKLVLDMESSMRGYRIVSNRSFLEPFEKAHEVLPKELNALERIVHGNPKQLAAVQDLRAAHQAWTEFAHAIRTRVEAKLPMDPTLQLQGKGLMESVHGHIAAMQAREQDVLQERSLAVERVRMFIMPAMLLAGLVFGPLIIGFIRRIFGALNSSYRSAWNEANQERERLNVILASIGDAVIATDTAGAIVYMNPIAATLTGWSWVEAQGKPLESVFKIINETSRKTVENPVEAVLREGRIVGLANHTLLLGKDGRETPIADSAAPIRDRTNQVTGVVLIFRDQSNERISENRLRISEARKAAVLDSSLDAIVGMDASGLIVEFNRAAETMFGHRAVDVIGQPLADVIVPERLRAAHNRGLAHYLASGEGPVLNKRIELPALRSDGTEFSVELSINRISGIEPPLFSGFIRDITERKRADEALRSAMEQAESASRAKDTFLAALSHELRTPLTPVLLTAAALHGDPSVPPELREQLGMIARSVALEARLIDDLLDVTHIARGKLSLRPEPCDAHSIIGLAVQIVREEAREKQIEIVIELDAHCNFLTGDPARLQQVFWNLLRNSVKFTQKGGRITIRTRDGACVTGEQPDTRLCIEVSDDGIGIEPNAMQRIFEPFEQGANPEDHRFLGLGLGLAIVRAIVDLHHGTIRAESRGVGCGATFIVELPGAKSEPAGGTPSPSPADGQSTDKPHVDTPMRLLVVEDHVPTIQVLSRLLTNAGHQVVCASSVGEALAAASTQKFDAVVSDLGLPDGTGIELMEKLRDQHGLRGIALSGYGMEEDVRRSSEAGFFAHLVKPVDLNELRRALRNLMSSGT